MFKVYALVQRTYKNISKMRKSTNYLMMSSTMHISDAQKKMEVKKMINLRYEAKQTISDIYKALNDATIDGVDDEMYRELKYMNHKYIQDYIDNHPRAQIRLIEQLAINEFIRQDDTIIEDKLREFEEKI